MSGGLILKYNYQGTESEYEMPRYTEEFKAQIVRKMMSLRRLKLKTKQRRKMDRYLDKRRRQATATDDPVTSGNRRSYCDGVMPSLRSPQELSLSDDNIYVMFS